MYVVSEAKGKSFCCILSCFLPKCCRSGVYGIYLVVVVVVVVG